MNRSLAIALIIVMFLIGISKASSAMMCGAHTQDTGKESNTKAVDVANTVCPVTGEKIDQKTKATYVYKDKAYNFCCPMCIDEFKKNPGKYADKISK